MRTHPTLNLATAAGFIVFGLLFAASASAVTLLGPDDFESGFGNWTNATADVFDWTRNSGGTGSSNTGPSGDHTSGSGYYLFTEASDPRIEGDDAILESPCIDLTGATVADLDFWYHMYGSGMGTLDVQVASSTGASCVSLGGYASAFSLSANQGDLWTAANVSLDAYTGGSIQIRIIGVIGSSYQSDIAIDDVEVTATLGPECVINEHCDDLDDCTDDVCNAGTCEYENICLDGQADYVIHISVDGLASYLLETRIDSPGYENLKRFVDEGATTYDGRIDYTQSWTLPNHVSMVAGRPAEQPAGQPNTVHHGYLDNGTPDPSWTLHDAQFNPNVSYSVSTWDVAHDNGLVTALYASKSKFVIFDQSYDSDSGAPDTTGPDNGTDKIDFYVNKESGSPLNGSEMHADFLADMAANRFNYTFLHYRDPDSAGHDFGWGSSQWDTSVQNVDDYLGDIFNLIEADPLLNGQTVVIVTADHGGTGTSHSDETNPLVYRIPIFVWGVGVDAGVDLYGMNPISRQDPNAPVPPGGAPVSRPDYNAVPQPIRDGGTGNLALYHLGLGPVSGSTLNASQDLNSQATRGRFTAYNDCVYDAALTDTDPNGQAVHYKADNATIYGIGTICSDCGSTGSGAAYSFDSGRLVNMSDGKPTPVTVSITEDNGVNWQSQVGPSGSPLAGTWDGGYGTASGTDARDTFGGIADMTGAVYYGTAGWWVDLEFTDLDPSKLYTFATSASRANSTGDYPTRVTIYTLSGVAASTNASTTGVTVISPTEVSFVTGDNHAEGYVARWTDIDPGADGTFTVRAEADPSSPEGRKAYAFDVFLLEEQAAEVCGDSTVDPGEDCDDGNTDPGDCCSPTCQYESAATECRASAGVCDAADYCDGAGSCTADAKLTSECRDSLDICDVAEVCDGVADDCPADVYEPVTTECRASAGVCDVAETCTGAGPACPADGFEPLGTACGDPGDTVCDDPDSCDAVGNCQANYEPPTTLCRAAVDVCDAPDYCDGASAPCPADAKLTTECRPSVQVCDKAEFCNGVWDHCPVDRPANGLPCPDGDLCNGDEVCVSYTCTAGQPLDCDDGVSCTTDSCDAVQGCANEPTGACTDLPSASPAGRLLLSLMLVGAGATFLAWRRCFGA